MALPNKTKGKLVGKGVRRMHLERATVQQPSISPLGSMQDMRGRLWWLVAFFPLQRRMHGPF